jgi:hypothetical protein
MYERDNVEPNDMEQRDKKNGFYWHTGETGDLTVVDAEDNTVLYFGDTVADSVELASSALRRS